MIVAATAAYASFTTFLFQGIGLLYFIAVPAILASTMILQGYSPNADAMNILWQAIYPDILLLCYWLSVKLQSKVFLTFATIFTFAEIAKLTGEYFSNTLGWSHSLIIAGLCIMAISVASYEVNKRFFP